MMAAKVQFDVHVKCVEWGNDIPWVGPVRYEVFVTPTDTQEARIVGRCTLSSYAPFELEEYLLDFTMPDGERRLHYVDGHDRAHSIIDAAYNLASRNRYQTPADELAFRRSEAPEAGSAEIKVGSERVGSIAKRGHANPTYEVRFDCPTPYGTGCEASSFEDAIKQVREMVWPRPQGFETLQTIFVRKQKGDSYAVFRVPAHHEWESDETSDPEEVRIGSASVAAPIGDALLVSFFDPLGHQYYFKAKDTEAAIRFISEQYNVGYHEGDTDKLVDRDGLWEVVRGPITIGFACDAPMFIYANESHVGTLYATHGGRTMAVVMDCENGARHTVHSMGQARRVAAERLKAATKSS